MEKQTAASESPAIKINLAEIPDHIRDNLAATTLECYKAFIKVPGNIEWLDQRIAARKAAAAAAK